MADRKLYYEHFSWQASIPFDCPLCHTHIPAGVKHECSNPKPKPTTKPRKRSKPDRGHA